MKTNWADQLKPLALVMLTIASVICLAMLSL